MVHSGEDGDSMLFEGAGSDRMVHFTYNLMLLQDIAEPISFVFQRKIMKRTMSMCAVWQDGTFYVKLDAFTGDCEAAQLCVPTEDSEEHN